MGLSSYGAKIMRQDLTRDQQQWKSVGYESAAFGLFLEQLTLEENSTDKG